MIYVVIDTNVLVSALITKNPEAATAKVVRLDVRGLSLAILVKTGLFLKQFHSLTAVADDVDTRRHLVTSGAIDVIVR